MKRKEGYVYLACVIGLKFHDWFAAMGDFGLVLRAEPCNHCPVYGSVSVLTMQQVGRKELTLNRVILPPTTGDDIFWLASYGQR